MKSSIVVPDFNLEATMDSGQVFGFKKYDDKSYEGEISGRLVVLRQEKQKLYFETGYSDLENTISDFFDLKRDLRPIYSYLTQDRRLRAVYTRFKGLRLIKQNPWYAIAGFIISSNNNIKRIQRIWRAVSMYFTGNLFLFPDPDQISSQTEMTLRKLGLGYRARFLYKVACKISADESYIENLSKMNYETAKLKLMELDGVGPKVADCILLYGFQKFEAFPVDVWILRIVRKLYFRNRDISKEKIKAYAKDKWGFYSGYVQQYLFHGARMGIL